MKKLVLTLLIVSCLAGCSGDARPGTKQQKDEERTKVQQKIAVLSADGSKLLGYDTMKVDHYEEGASSEAPPLTWWERTKKRLTGWLIGLSLGWAVLYFVLGAGPAIAIVTWAIKFMTSSVRGFRQVVKAVKESGAVGTNIDLHAALKSNLDTKTKAWVGKVKAKL